MSEETQESVESQQPEGQPATGEPSDVLGDAGKAAIDRMKQERNAAASRAKALEKELNQLRQASLTESERAVAEAKAAGRAEALAESGRRLARAEFRAAASAAGVDVSPLLEDIDVSRYVGDDGEPDEKKITDAVKRFAVLTQPQRPRGDIGQGPRAQSETPSMDDLIRRQLAGRK